MRLRRLAWLVVLGAVAGAVIGRRRRQVAAARADVWFDDGSMVSLPATSGAGAGLVELAGHALRAAR